MDPTATTKPHNLLCTSINLFLPGAHGLYSASLPVEYSKNSTVLCAVSSVKALSAVQYSNNSTQ